MDENSKKSKEEAIKENIDGLYIIN